MSDLRLLVPVALAPVQSATATFDLSFVLLKLHGDEARARRVEALAAQSRVEVVARVRRRDQQALRGFRGVEVTRA